MKNPFKYLFVIVLFTAAFYGCKDELVKAPLDAPSNTNFYSNEEELIMAVNGAYTALWWTHGAVQVPMMIDNATDLGFLRGGWFNADLATIPLGSGTSETDIFGSTWNHFYSAVAKTNNLLDNMSRAEGEVDKDTYQRIEAEARFLRAFYYHWLIELYGDVPLLTNVPEIEEAQKERTPKDQVVDQIINDLDFASQNLPETWSGDNEGRVTRGAALALKARVSLYNGMFDVASQAAQEVINSGTYSLHPNYEEVFQYEGIRNSGVIFDAPYSRAIQVTSIPQHEAPRAHGGWSDIVPSQFIIDSYEAIDGEPIDESLVYDPAHPFENRDPRLDASIVRPQSIFADVVFETHPDSTETWRITDGDSTRISNHDVTNAFATFTGYIWRKYLSADDIPSDLTSSRIHWIYIRYAEVLLTYAEATLESSGVDQSVLEAINEVRARAYGVDPSQTSQYPAITTTNESELRRVVRRERKVELANEGFRLFDIRRWEIANEVMGGPLIGRPKGAYSGVSDIPTIDNETGHPDYGTAQDLYREVETRVFISDKDWLWAIPQSEINVNEHIEQNPGYTAD